MSKTITCINGHHAIVRSNELTSARYSLSTDAHRLLAVAIAQISKEDKSLTTYKITTQQFIQFFPSLKTDKNAIARIDKATDVLMSSFIKIKNKNGWIKKNLVHSCQLLKEADSSILSIRLDNDMMPYLIGVSGHFSAPKLENLKHFKKDQHFKLYSFFFSHLFKGSTSDISIKVLREILDIKKNQYEKIGHLKSRLLNPSIILINQVTDIDVSMIEIKHSRKIIAFNFKIIKKSMRKKLILAHPIKETLKVNHENESTLKPLWLNNNEYQGIIKKHGDAYAQQLFKYVIYQSKKQAIKSPKSYLYGIIKNKPELDDLLTPDDHSRLVKEKHKKIDQGVHAQSELDEKKRHTESIKIKSAVDQFISASNSTELEKLKNKFNTSVFSHGIKFGADQVDFNKPLVKACFTRYIWQHYLS